MKIKIAIVFFFIFFVIQYACAEPLKAGISYTVNEARIEAFSQIPMTIDLNKYNKYFYDPNHEKNMKALLKKKNRIGNKKLTIYSNKNYEYAQKCKNL